MKCSNIFPFCFVNRYLLLFFIFFYINILLCYFLVTKIIFLVFFNKINYFFLYKVYIFFLNNFLKYKFYVVYYFILKNFFLREKIKIYFNIFRNNLYFNYEILKYNNFILFCYFKYIIFFLFCKINILFNLFIINFIFKYNKYIIILILYCIIILWYFVFLFKFFFNKEMSFLNFKDFKYFSLDFLDKYVYRKYNNMEFFIFLKILNKIKCYIKKYLNKKSILVAGICHDLRIPLTRICLTLEIMRNSSNFNNELIDFINRDIIECNLLIEQFLNYIKINFKEKKYKLVNLNKILMEIINLSNFHGKDIEVLVSKENIFFKVDEFSIKRVIYNIINNAINYSNNWIKISSGYNFNKEYTWFQVEDDGAGMSKGKVKFLFKPFNVGRKANINNTKYFNKGLGLFIVKNIIFSHGGRIKTGVSSRNGFLIKIIIPSNISK